MQKSRMYNRIHFGTQLSNQELFNMTPSPHCLLNVSQVRITLRLKPALTAKTPSQGSHLCSPPSQDANSLSGPFKLPDASTLASTHFLTFFLTLAPPPQQSLKLAVLLASFPLQAMKEFCVGCLVGAQPGALHLVSRHKVFRRNKLLPGNPCLTVIQVLELRVGHYVY